MYHLIRPALIVGVSVLCLQACATGEGASFATRVDGGSAQPATEDSTTETASNDPDSGFMATSGNAILPGGVMNVLPGLAGLGGGNSGSGLFGQGGSGLTNTGDGLTALVGATANLELSGPNGPGVSVSPTAGVTASSTLAPLAPVTGAVNGLTGGASGNLLGSVTGGAPVLSAGGGAVPSVAGQPVTLLAGATPVLGAATPATNAVVNPVAPVTSTLVNVVAGAAAPPPAAGGGSPSGLGGLAALVPPLLPHP